MPGSVASGTHCISQPCVTCTGLGLHRALNTPFPYTLSSWYKTTGRIIALYFLILAFCILICLVYIVVSFNFLVCNCCWLACVLL